MKRNLAKQMRHEWRDNIWLVIELLIIGLVIWILTAMVGRLLRDTFLDLGVDVENVYTLDIGEISEASPEYIQADTTRGFMSVRAESIRTLLAELRKSPYIEAVAQYDNALPYNFNYSGERIEIEPFGQKILYEGNHRLGTPDIVEVIRPTSLDGTSIVQMKQALAKGEIFISPNPDSDSILDTKTVVGRQAKIMNIDGTLRIAGRIHSIRRNEFEGKTGTILRGISENDDENISRMWNMALRIKPGMTQKFIDQFNSTPKMQRSGNVVISNLTDIRDIREQNQRNSENIIRLAEVGIIFFLAIIFLGLIGSFWFRVQQRSGEIALRKTCGATNRDIMARTLGEGYLLVVAAAIPGTAIAAFITYSLNSDSDILFNSLTETWLFAAGSWIATLLFLLITVTLGILWPMLRALKVEPAIALKSE